MNFKSFTAQLAGAASIISNGNLPRVIYIMPKRFSRAGKRNQSRCIPEARQPSGSQRRASFHSLMQGHVYSGSALDIAGKID